jgi:hypothetical protein
MQQVPANRHAHHIFAQCGPERALALVWQSVVKHKVVDHASCQEAQKASIACPDGNLKPSESMKERSSMRGTQYLPRLRRSDVPGATLPVIQHARCKQDIRRVPVARRALNEPLDTLRVLQYGAHAPAGWGFGAVINEPVGVESSLDSEARSSSNDAHRHIYAEGGARHFECALLVLH